MLLQKDIVCWHKFNFKIENDEAPFYLTTVNIKFFLYYTITDY